MSRTIKVATVAAIATLAATLGSVPSQARSANCHHVNGEYARGYGGNGRGLATGRSAAVGAGGYGAGQAGGGYGYARGGYGGNEDLGPAGFREGYGRGGYGNGGYGNGGYGNGSYGNGYGGERDGGLFGGLFGGNGGGGLGLGIF